MRGVRANLIGERFGNLVVIGPATGSRPGQHWSCLCDCGKSCVKLGKDLTKDPRQRWIHTCGCRATLVKDIQAKFRGSVSRRLTTIHVEQKARKE